MTRTLRKWQAAAIDALRKEWDNGVARTAVVAATGMGKSSVIGKVATDEAAAGGRVLIAAHREELLSQLRDACHAFDPDVPVGWVQAGRNEVRRPITVAMAPTIGRPARRRRMVKPTLVIVDECHRAANPTYRSILEWAGCFDEDNPTRLLGVTATFTRGDKRGLGDVFESVACSYGIPYGIDEGYLVRPHGKVVVASGVDLSKAKTSRGDYVDKDLGEMVSQSTEEIVRAWLTHAGDRITVAFVPTVAAAEELVDEYGRQGVKAEAVTGNTPTPDRQAMYARLADGTTRVLVNVFVLVEGWDCPPVSCVLMARPTKLPGVYQQAVGRGLRLSPETGKDSALILDVVGATRHQKLTTLVDLLPSAEQDTLEVDVLPCDDCGGYRGRKPAVIAEAEQRGMVPCSCPCESCGEDFDGAGRCACEPDDAGRDPDGGRRRLQGPARYETLDLLGLGAGDGDEGSALNWLLTHAGHPFLAAGQRYACLHQEPNGLWTAAHVAKYGALDAHLLVEYASREHAVAAVEKWARQAGCYPRGASWRLARERASDKQVAAARRVGLSDPESYTKGGISDAMDVVLASRQLDRTAGR